MRSLRTAGLIVSLIILSSCSSRTLLLKSPDGSRSVDVKVEIADTEEERSQGLMNRESLAPDAGMLFVFREPQVLSFWMKNTKIPLEILYFDANGSFSSAVQMVPCTEDPCQQYPSHELVKYALEVNPDFRERHGVNIGWMMDVEEVEKMSEPD